MLRRLVVPTVVLLALGGTSRASVLFTPPNFPASTAVGVSLRCVVLNVSNKQEDALIEVLNGGGAIRTKMVTLGPGEDDFVQAVASESPLYCKFTVKGGKTSVRASGCLFDGTVGCVSTVPAT